MLAFAVKDTGIGISRNTSGMSSMHFARRTGRSAANTAAPDWACPSPASWAHLLRGAIQLQKRARQGEHLYHYPAGNIKREPRLAEYGRCLATGSSCDAAPVARGITRAQAEPLYVKDDRENWSQAPRTILVVEDDESFAYILYDMVHELEFPMPHRQRPRRRR